LANLKSLEKVNAEKTGITGKNILAPFFFGPGPMTMLSRMFYR
jgi:hypothetical protein